MELIKQIIDTLEQIEVHGKDNMSRLLGCIYALEEIAQKNTQSEKETTPSNEDGGDN